MKTYFDIRNGLVAIIETDTPDEGMTELAHQQSRLGARYRVEKGQVIDAYPGKTDEEVLAEIAASQVAQPAELMRPYFISKFAFMERFTDQELAAIYTAAKEDVRVEVWMDKLKLVSEVDLAMTRTHEGVYALEEMGLILQGRAQEILAVALS